MRLTRTWHPRGGSSSQKFLLLAVTNLLLSVADPLYVKTNNDRHQHMMKLELSVDTLSWDMDKLEQIDNLTQMDFDNKKLFEDSYDLMHYLGLEQVHGLHMAVPLNLIFVGFEGTGNFRVNVTYDDLVKWFEHVDHVLPHSRIALSELSCSEDGQCSKFKAGPRPQPLLSYVHLNFSCQVIQMNDKEVLDVFDQAIFAFSRPVDPENEEGPQQVDMERMEEFINFFFKITGHNNHPAVLVLNPNWSATRPQYGYRMGFSDKEISFLLRRNENAKVFAMSRSRENRDMEPDLSPYSAGSMWHWGFRPAPNKFAQVDARHSSEFWVKSARDFLNREQLYRKALLAEVGRVPGASSIAHAIRVLSNPKRAQQKLLRLTLLSNPGSGLGNRFRTMLPIEDCLVGNWVSRQRWLMLDLTAWGYQWGPALGGEGAVHRSSVPNVQDFFQAVKDRKDTDLIDKEKEADRKLREMLDNMKTHTVANYANQHHHAYMQNQNRMAGAPGSDNPEQQLQRQRDWEARYKETLIQAELDVLEIFALRHCNNVVNPPLPCVDARDQAAELKQRLQTLSASSSSIQTLDKDHQWDIFGHHSSDAHGPGVITEELRARDLFLAELAAILSRAIRHVVTPPSATWHHKGYLHDTATPFSTVVNFQLYLIRDTSRRVPANSEAYFEVEQFKAQVESLKLSNQKFRFEPQQMHINDDPGLAVAFATSLRTSFQELPGSQLKEMLSNEQVYLDSQVLAHELRKQRPRAEQKVYNPHGYLEVPVYIFLLEREYPVLIDEHYSAKALEDMVVVVHNAMNQMEHPSGMMCNGALISRPSSSMKEALAAVLQHLGGVLPPHLGYNPTRHQITHDWLWSVGYHALSATAHGPQYTDLQRDALYRSYILDAIDTSVEMVNTGLKHLERVTSHDAFFETVNKQKPHMMKLLRTYQHLMHLWKDMVRSAYHLEFHEAAVRIVELEGLSRVFKMLCKLVHDEVQPLTCAVELGHLPSMWMPSKWLMLSLLLLFFAGVAGAVWYKRRNSKPKLN